MTNRDYDESEDSSPIAIDHLRWHANIFGANDFPMTFECLLDSGAHLNLIRPEAVVDLGLSVKKLKRPIPIAVAFQDSSAVKSFEDYVSITLSSRNNAWSSHTVKAIVAPGLCHDILLGLPFLSHNQIVIDHTARTAIDKVSGFDLLNENAHIPMRKIKAIAPRVRRAELKRELELERELVLNLRKVMITELKSKLLYRNAEKSDEQRSEPVLATNVITAVSAAIEFIASKERLAKLEINLKSEFREIFEPIPHVSQLPTKNMARIEIDNAYRTLSSRSYPCPRKYKDAFSKLIQQRLDSGFIRPSSSQFLSPSFIIPKADPTALPRWVCDYRALNKITVPDHFPLPRVDDILADCAKGKIWATFDMTDSFFQTPMHPDDIHKTAVSTPLGAYEWCVMPMGFRNSPAIQQRRVTEALRKYIGKICHVYLDDIVVWSNSVDEHVANVRKIMEALRAARLYVNEKKTKLFCSEIIFLGHKISCRGVEADSKKVDQILNWPAPKTAKEVRQFLGLVRYLNAFLPRLAMESDVLSKLTTKECEKKFPGWSETHQVAFDNIKSIVVSRECLTVIDHDNMEDNKKFLTTDASDLATGAVLSFGLTWETARPVAFDSKTLKDAELNYPTHEKELLAILRGIRKWKVDLLGAPFLVYTDHKTLLNFDTQKDLSRRQARWMEELSIYDCKFVYVKGEDNSAADALSRYPTRTVTEREEAEVNACHPYRPDEQKDVTTVFLNRDLIDSPFCCVAALMTVSPTKAPDADNRTFTKISIDDKLVMKLKAAYERDPWCKKLIQASKGIAILTCKDGLWFLGERLVVPADCGVREQIFRLAHDNLGHFGFFKTYEAVREAYFWPNMRKDLEEGYIPSCVECQRNKSSTSRKRGPLHPLPVPNGRCDSVSLDFVGPLPEDEGFDCVLTMTDRLNSEVRIIPTKTTLTAEELAVIFFDGWYCENGLPSELVSDRDKLFMAKFWKHFTLLTGVKHKYSSAYHPQSNGASERTNKTVNQCIRFHVERNQKGWVRALPRIRFQMMCTVNKSTGYSPFQLRFGRSPKVLPPLIPLLQMRRWNT